MKIKLALTDARPVNVTEKLWPVVARGILDRDHNNQELFDRYYIRVRQHGVRLPNDCDGIMEFYGGDKDDALPLRPHRDGQIIVTAYHSTSWQGEPGLHAGFRGTLDEAAELIRRAGELIGAPEHVIAACISDLPAEEMPELADWSDEELAQELAARKK